MARLLCKNTYVQKKEEVGTGNQGRRAPDQGTLDLGAQVLAVLKKLLLQTNPTNVTDVEVQTT